MTEYKRLTTKGEEGNWQVWEDDYSHPFEALQCAIDRLAELEDKIENGTLVEIGKPYIKRFGDTNYYNICIVKEVDHTTFLTKAEAEKKLKKLRGNGNDL